MAKQWFIAVITARVVSPPSGVKGCRRRALFPTHLQTLIVCLAAGLAAILTTSVAWASIAGYTGDIELVSPPQSVRLGAFESNSSVRVFTEREDVMLTRGVAVNISSPGSYGFSLTPGTIPKGTQVNSYYVHFDSVRSEIAYYSGTLTFDTDVLGLITYVSQRLACDSILGVPGTLYPGTNLPGDLEFATDRVTLSADRRTLTLSGGTDIGIDQIRVITASASPPPDTDPSAPTTTALLSLLPNAAGWHNTDVTVTLNAVDEGGSGTQELTYSATGAQPLASTTVEGASTSFTLTAEGETTVTFSARDNAGNVEEPATITIRIDKTAPTISGSRSPAANAAGWNKTDVTVSFTCQDALSGVASCTDPVTLTTEGAGQSVTGSVVDQAGNSASFTVGDIQIDKTPPTVTLLSRLPAANAAGWNHSDVTATFQASDALSGVEGETTAAVVLSAEGANLSASHVFTDRAGNTATGSESAINIDKTPPTITPSRAPAANAHGWNNTDVTVSFVCADALSGIASCFEPTTLTSEGANQGATGTATDKAGNTASASVSDINIDRTPPTVTLLSRLPAANAAGWNNTEVTATFQATDTLSGVDGDTTVSVVLTAEGANLTASHSFTDQAGNKATVSESGINIDKTPPTLTPSRTLAANASGWNNTDVTVSFTCQDALSGVATCPAPTTLTSEGVGQSVTGTVTDLAGNTANVTVSDIRIDKTAPSLTFAPPSPAANVAGWHNTDVSISFTASDSLSGVAITSPATPLLFATEGAGLTATVTVTDQAGNSARFTAPPVNLDKTPPTVTYAGNAGSYTVDQVVSISCSASDGLSGVAAHTCQDISGYAGAFAVGLNSFSASATDQAGNTGSGATSFTVVVTSESLAKLTRQLVTHPDTAQFLVAKLEAAAAAAARGNEEARVGAITAYIQQVQALSGKSLTVEQAELLIRLARAL
jgi:hypothetical protein